MQQNIILLTNTAANFSGQGVFVPPSLSKRSFVVSLTGTGALSATVTVDVSNDNGVNWASRIVFTLSGSGSASDTAVDEISPFSMLRGTVTNLAGTGAAVSLAGCAV